MRLFAYQIVQQDRITYKFDLSKHPNMDDIKKLEYFKLVDMCQKSLNLIYSSVNKRRQKQKLHPIIIKVVDALISGNELKVIIE